MNLKQKSGSETRIFEIIDNGLRITERSEFGEIRRIVPFESISNDFVKVKFNPIQWAIIVLAIVVVIISGFFLRLFGIEDEGRIYYYLIIGLISGLAWILVDTNKQTLLSCYDVDGIEFYKDNPTKTEFNIFLEQLFERRNLVLREKYAFVSEFISFEDQVSKLDQLHSLGIIGLDEWKELRMQLDELAKKENRNFDINLN